jgi:hypothetical protein
MFESDRKLQDRLQLPLLTLEELQGRYQKLMENAELSVEDRYLRLDTLLSEAWATFRRDTQNEELEQLVVEITLDHQKFGGEYDKGHRSS